MHSLIPVSALYSNRKRGMRRQRLSEHDVVRAHIAAPGFLAETRSRQRAFWRRRAFDLLLSGTVPVIGFAFGWPLLWILLALMTDVAGHWLADTLRLYLRPQALTDEIDHALDGERTLATIESLRVPMRIDGQRLQCWISDDFRAHPSLFVARVQHLLWLVICVLVPAALLGEVVTTDMLRDLKEFAPTTPMAMLLLALPLLMRPLVVLIDMLRADRGDNDLSLLPETPLHGLIFVVACEAPLLLAIKAEDFGVLRYWGQDRTELLGAWVFLLSFLALNALIAYLWFARQRRHAALLRGFVAQDRDEWKRRWANYNG